jgi:hypothetical protein
MSDEVTDLHESGQVPWDWIVVNARVSNEGKSNSYLRSCKKLYRYRGSRDREKTSGHRIGTSMDTETTKRLKGWFYLRLTPDDWTIFGESAESVLRTFDYDRDPDAILHFPML